jgi:hypothetical protein
MMRTLIALLFLTLLAGCASVKPVAPQAEPREHRELYAMNSEGGVMTLTNDPCDKQAPPGVIWFDATTETNDPKFADGLIRGCWLFAKDYPGIIVHWETGHASAILDPKVLTARRPQSLL